jgi:hypothetical protein
MTGVHHGRDRRTIRPHPPQRLRTARARHPAPRDGGRVPGAGGGLQPRHRRAIPDTPEHLQPDDPDRVRGNHGDGHGLRHRDAAHRPFGRFAAGHVLGDHGDHADPDHAAADGAGAEPPADRTHRHPRGSGDGSRDWSLPRLARRIPDDPGLHRHAGRAAHLAQRRVVSDQRPDHRPARRELPALRRYRRHAGRDVAPRSGTSFR